MIVGNLISLAEQGRFDCIIHGCNCFNTMDAGIAVQLKHRYPQVYASDNETERGDRSKLGTYTVANCVNYTKNIYKHFMVINAYTQYSYGTKSKHVDYSAIKRVFTSLAPELVGLRIGYTRIGCGLAGGEWRLVKDIIDTAFEGLNHEMVALR